MLRLDRIVKPWKESGALNAHINLYGFWNCQVLVVQHLSPLAERFIGGKDHGSFSQVAIVDDMKQDIGGIGTVG